KPAIERKHGLTNELRRLGDRLAKRDVLARDFGPRRRQHSFEASDRAATARLANLETVSPAFDLEIVADHAAKRARDILKQFRIGHAAGSLAQSVCIADQRKQLPPMRQP